MDHIPNFASDSAGVLGHVGGNLVRVRHPWEVAEVLCAPGTLEACKVAKAYFGRTASGTVEEHARRMRKLTPVAMQATDAAILTGLLPETRAEGLALGMSEAGASMVEPFHELKHRRKWLAMKLWRYTHQIRQTMGHITRFSGKPLLQWRDYIWISNQDWALSIRQRSFKYTLTMGVPFPSA